VYFLLLLCCFFRHRKKDIILFSRAHNKFRAKREIPFADAAHTDTDKRIFSANRENNHRPPAQSSLPSPLPSAELLVLLLCRRLKPKHDDELSEVDRVRKMKEILLVLRLPVVEVVVVVVVFVVVVFVFVVVVFAVFVVALTSLLREETTTTLGSECFIIMPMLLASHRVRMRSSA